jgi:hypothetical protein
LGLDLLEKLRSAGAGVRPIRGLATLEGQLKGFLALASPAGLQDGVATRLL